MAGCKKDCQKDLGEMKITVVIPVYNAENYLLRAIDSVLSQPEVNELILVEDGSSDGSKKLCIQAATTHSRIKLLFHPGNKNKGVSASRNLGIKNAKNEIIAFLDADDYYLPFRFNLALERLSNDKNIDGIYEPIGIHNSSSELTLMGTYDWINPVNLFEQLSPVGEYIWFSIDGLTLRKSIFEEVCYFDEKLETNEDSLIWLQFAANKNLVCGNIHKPVAIAETLESGLSSKNELVIKNQIIMLVKLFEFMKNNKNNGRRELVLNRLLFYAGNEPYRQSFKGIKLYSLIIKIILIDINFVLVKSKSFRRFIGDILKLNKLKAIKNSLKFL